MTRKELLAYMLEQLNDEEFHIYMDKVHAIFFMGYADRIANLPAGNI